MTVKQLSTLVEKAGKMFYYERYPHTQEQYLRLKKSVEKKIADTEKKLSETGNERYKEELKLLKIRAGFIIEREEYEQCKKFLEESKALYCKVIPQWYWNYMNLLEINMRIRMNLAKTVKEAVSLYEYDIDDMIRFYYEDQEDRF